jgi:4-hydroxy-3-polyprenylbenzoate decarboxylase
MKLVIGITGASGSVFGWRTLEVLRELGVETHLVVSKWGQQTLEHETGSSLAQLRALASASYAAGEMGAAISSGSFKTDGMAIVPCSMRTVAAIAHGYGDNLVHRAAEVTLKERRRLVIVPRETPLTEIHLENMLKLARLGVVVLPPDPAFYNKPQSVADIVDHIVARILDQFGLSAPSARRWEGDMRRDEVVALRPKA